MLSSGRHGSVIVQPQAQTNYLDLFKVMVRKVK